MYLKGLPRLLSSYLPAMQELQETEAQSLDWEDSLKEGMATHSGFLAWRIPWTEEPSRLHSIGSQRVGYDWNFSSVQFTRSVVSDSLRPHESHHARPPCPSPTPGAYPYSCASSQCCHPAISSSVVPFSSCPQSLPASGSFRMSQLFAWGGQSTGVSASTSVLPMNTQDWSLLGWTGWISLQFKGLSRIFSNTTVQKHQFFSTQLSSQSNSHIHTWSLKTIALTRWTFVDKVMSAF